MKFTIKEVFGAKGTKHEYKVIGYSLHFVLNTAYDFFLFDRASYRHSEYHSQFECSINEFKDANNINDHIIDYINKPVFNEIGHNGSIEATIKVVYFSDTIVLTKLLNHLSNYFINLK
jgi:hypothetical protein